MPIYSQGPSTVVDDAFVWGDAIVGKSSMPLVQRYLELVSSQM